MFDFGGANENQKHAISTTQGPVLITAGPGTGKTFTLVQRAIYLIQEHGVKPNEILIATFTEKAAKELITRITNELSKKNIKANINEMYIGTFHSICLRIIKDNLEFTTLDKGFKALDAFDQCYTVFENISKFRQIDGLNALFGELGAWRTAQLICQKANKLFEELVDFRELKNDESDDMRTLGAVLEVYEDILRKNNLIDFTAIQTQAHDLLVNNPKILKYLQEKLHFLMIDEYQDTNYIQEKIVFMLGGERQNICVVGDDDQGLYRFRGATIRNILEFPAKFKEDSCKIIPLATNYRSNSDIVEFYNNWMSGDTAEFSWGKYRYQKTIIPHKKSELKSPCVVKLSSMDNQNLWHENILNFINDLKLKGKINNYNQIAFLFNSVKSKNAIDLANFLENNGISVYSPRSDMFFKRYEIKIALGFFMIMFLEYVDDLRKNNFEYLRPEHKQYYEECIDLATAFIKRPENNDFRVWLGHRAKSHSMLESTTDYAYSGLLYMLFGFEPFKSFLGVDMHTPFADTRPVRNLALLSQIIAKFEYLHNIDVLNAKILKSTTEKFFNLYLRLLIDGGIGEYEDDSEYAPSGCVSFLTIHQAKGMEFPIVFVDSLGNSPRQNSDELVEQVLAKYTDRKPFEPDEQIKFFDFYRLYYTAFSRAQDLLILTCNQNSRTPSKYFKDSFSKLKSTSSDEFRLDEFSFHEVKPVTIKQTYSFTSHIAIYETCAMQYKFYKELGFIPVRAGAMIFGTLVHASIEDIHKVAIRGESELITEENIAKWFNANYASISKAERAYLAPKQREAALNQVLEYAKAQSNNWSRIKQAEVDVSLVKDEYILEGKIDLIKGEDDTVEIVDFKAQKKHDIFKDKEILERYRRQLNLYAHLVEERTGQRVSKMSLYYTAEKDGLPTITYPYTKTAIDGTLASFDSAIGKITKKDFRACATDPKVCLNCDFKTYCQSR